MHRPKASWKEGKEQSVLEAENAKEEATLEAVKLRFGTEKIDLELWSNIIISFQNQLGESKEYKANSLQPISCFFDSFALTQGEGEREEDYRFVYEQNDVVAGDTPSSLGMTPGDSNIIVKAVHKDLTKVTFLHSKGDGIWDVMLTKNIPLVGYFDEFAKDHLKDTTRKDLVFSFNGRRLYGFDTAITLKFVDGDIIDATPVKEVSSHFFCDVIDMHYLLPLLFSMSPRDATVARKREILLVFESHHGFFFLVVILYWLYSHWMQYRLDYS